MRSYRSRCACSGSASASSSSAYQRLLALTFLTATRGCACTGDFCAEAFTRLSIGTERAGAPPTTNPPPLHGNAGGGKASLGYFFVRLKTTPLSFVPPFCVVP